MIPSGRRLGKGKDPETPVRLNRGTPDSVQERTLLYQREILIELGPKVDSLIVTSIKLKSLMILGRGLKWDVVEGVTRLYRGRNSVRRPVCNGRGVLVGRLVL